MRYLIFLKMSQEEIIKVLKTDPNKWWTSEELVRKTGKHKCSILKHAGQLAEHDIIDQKWVYKWSGICNKPMYGFRIRGQNGGK